MPWMYSKIRSEQPFVKLGTIRDMTDFGKKLSAMKASAELIEEIEAEMVMGVDKQVLRRLVGNLLQSVSLGRQNTGDAKRILESIKKKVERYLGELKNATD